MNRHATATIVGLVLILSVVSWSRFAHVAGEPAFLREPVEVWVQLGDGFSGSGLARQYVDECRLGGVIELTGYALNSTVLEKYPMGTLIESGRRIDLIVQGSEIQSISFSWMPASQRVVLGIPLHPDCMTQIDWEYLPGIGEKMAARIENNRQKNGDFGSFEGLLRVKGLGSGKLAAWREFY